MCENAAVSPREILRSVRVEPSILSADFGRLREQVQEVLDAGARVIHVDVMDGHFVPQITLGPVVLASLREQAQDAEALLDVHLMIERPERHVEDFVKAGADSITVHAESTPHLAYAAALVRDGGASVGVALNPATPIQAVSELTEHVDLVLCMTINPGWAGQELIETTLGKARRLRELLPDRVAVQVDGGVDMHTAPRCQAAGANLFVAGSAVFGSSDPAAAYRAIVAAVDAA